MVIPFVMNVTFVPNPGQAPFLPCVGKTIPCILAVELAALLTSAIVARAETFTNFEAVDDLGVSAWDRSFPIFLTGVLLTDPNEMLDATPNFVPWDDGANAYDLGGQWQVFVQAVTNGDRGGVECWMGQNYGNLPWEPHDGSDSYSDDAWTAEVNRESHDPVTGHAFHSGDLVTITANGSLFYGGMQNINEEHNPDPTNDFTISLVSSNFGLPTPEVISLSSVVSTNRSAMGHYDIFDPTRASGGEHWQGMRVRINGLTLITTNGWNTDSDWYSRFCTATDGEGRQFPLIHPLYDIGPAPTNQFDATGVFLQESGSSADGTFGYELFVQEIALSDAAFLNIAVQNGSAVISWPGSLANYRLQSCDSLFSPNWTAVTDIPANVSGQNSVVLSPAESQVFFRLQRVQ